MEGKIPNDNTNETIPSPSLEATIVEIKIKTLDSQVYTCRVGKNVSVPDLKEQVAIVTGVPSRCQRLICRGKVLKDEHVLSAYDVEDGHTLHLVTRPVPPLATSTTSEEIHGEEQGTSLNNRPGHISHSVLVGTFNIPERGGVVFPEINRIFSSVLSTLRAGSAASTGSNSTASTLEVPLNLGRGDNVDGREQERITQLRMGTNHTDSRGSGMLNGELLNHRADLGFLNAIPAVSRVRIVQQIVPDAIRSASQYVNRLEQTLAGQVTPAPDETPSPNPRREADHQQPPVRTDDDPAAWAAIIRRVHDILSSQAGSQFRRFAEQLEGEPSIQTAAARGSLLSAGVLMERLGLILMEVGGTMLSLSRDSPQPSGGLGSLASQDIMGSPSSMDVDDRPREIDIRIHAGLPPFVSDLFSLNGQDGLPLTLSIEGIHDAQDDQERQRNMVSSLHSLDSQQATVGSMIPEPNAPESSQDNLAVGADVFYPLLARIQQLNPMLLPRHAEFVQEPTGGADQLLSRGGLISNAHQTQRLSLRSLMEHQLRQVTGIGETGSSPNASSGEPMLDHDIGIVNSGLSLGSSRIGREMSNTGQIIANPSQDAECPVLQTLQVPEEVGSRRDQPESSQLCSHTSTAQADTEISLQLGSKTLMDNGSNKNMQSVCLVIPETNETENMEVEIDDPGINSNRFQPLASGKRMRDESNRESSLEDDLCQQKRLCDHIAKQTIPRELQTVCDCMEGMDKTSSDAVLQDFLSTLAVRQDQNSDAELSVGKCTQEWSLSLRNPQEDILSSDNGSGVVSHTETRIPGTTRNQECNDCDSRLQLHRESPHKCFLHSDSSSQPNNHMDVEQNMDGASLLLSTTGTIPQVQQSCFSSATSDERQRRFV